MTGTTVGTGAQSGSCAPSGGAGEAVFAWTPAASGIATIQTCGTGTTYDSVLYVRRSACSGASELACNDDTAGCGTGEPSDHHGSRITLSVNAGQTYFIAVDGYATATGTFSLLVVPPSGTCANPYTIPAGGGVLAGATSGAGQLAGTCAPTGTSPEVVYQWTPGTSGAATLQTCGGGTSYDTVLYMRSGDCLAGAELACNDDSCAVSNNDHWGSRIVPTVTAGQTYFVVVDGYDGRSGSFALTVTPPP